MRDARTLYLDRTGSFVRSGNRADARMACNNLGGDPSEWLARGVLQPRDRDRRAALDVPLLARLYADRAEPGGLRWTGPRAHLAGSSWFLGREKLRRDAAFPTRGGGVHPARELPPTLPNQK